MEFLLRKKRKSYVRVVNFIKFKLLVHVKEIKLSETKNFKNKIDVDRSLNLIL